MKAIHYIHSLISLRLASDFHGCDRYYMGHFASTTSVTCDMLLGSKNIAIVSYNTYKKLILSLKQF